MKCSLNLLLISLLVCVSAVFSRSLPEENRLAKRATLDYKNGKHTKLYAMINGKKVDFEYISIYGGELYAEDAGKHRTYIFKLHDIKKNCRNYNDRNLDDVFLIDNKTGKKVYELFKYNRLDNKKTDKELGNKKPNNSSTLKKSEVTVFLTFKDKNSKCRIETTFKYNGNSIHDYADRMKGKN
ncbi:hypothetical protein PIROE2DRAFT_63272 [Piromyces sp. E2]|nr:hypothetical protein PIROE2DRAFT_63272 [Piromyces sp. E2]|eukprot:OUM60258.1 hypothetical protein PIROE2DRAFT_63272 [Piromyces sp. E2]